VPESSETYMEKILNSGEIPHWLRPLFYPIPEGFDIKNERLRLFAVLPDQTAAQSSFHQGIYAFESGNFPKANELFQKTETLSPLEPDLPYWISETAKKLQK
jgi:hypothetical protein